MIEINYKSNMKIVDSLLTLSVLLLSPLFIQGNVIVERAHNQLNSACGGRVYVEDSIVLYAPNQEDCSWQIETQKGNILAFNFEGTLEQALEHFTIHDGLKPEDRVLSVKNQAISRKNSSQAIYTTGSLASVRFVKSPTSALKIRISKAVECLPNLGLETECNRVVDDVSCYCAIYTRRNHADQTNFCAYNGMKLLSLETGAEERAIQAFWGTATYFWTSLTDIAKEGEWIWQSTNASVTSYINWLPGQPDNGGGDQDCMRLNWGTTLQWDDLACSGQLEGICEQHP